MRPSHVVFRKGPFWVGFYTFLGARFIYCSCGWTGLTPKDYREHEHLDDRSKVG